MKIAIYQIDPERDGNNVAFLNYENLERFQGSAALRSEIYDKVFEGEVECGTLEEVYQMFNLDHPNGYRGRSLSVSDVVEVVGEEKSTFHFCDSIGFREVDFDPDMTEPLKEKKIKVVLCEPGKVARVAEIGTELSDLQRVVGGLIEPYYPFEEQVCIVCNDEGKYNGMRPCRAIYGEDREMMDIMRTFENNGSKGSRMLVGCIFWLPLLLGYILVILANLERKTFIRSRLDGDISMQCHMGVVTFFSNTPAVIADATLLAGSIALVIIYFCDVANQYITYVMLAIVSFSLNMHGLFNGRIYKTTKYKRTRRVENHE